MVNAVELIDVGKHYGRMAAVAGLSFAVAPGETIALLGPSGCGKTTTLRLIAGFEAPDTGAVYLAGESVARKRPYERSVGLLFQHYALFPHMTVAENVAYGLRHRGFPRADIPRRVAEMLELVKLADKGGQHPGRLSGGQQQRVALARALATQPDVVLLDEPLSALDARLRQELREELRRVLGAVGATTIVVTHDQEEAMSLAERIIVMNRGTIAQQGTPDDIYSRPTSRFVAEFMGQSNWFRGRVTGQAGTHGMIVTTRSGMNLVVPAAGYAEDDDIDICIRPERMDIHWGMAPSTPPDAASGVNQLVGRIAESVPLGANRQLRIMLTDGSFITASVPNRIGRVAPMTEHVTVRFAADDCIVLVRADGISDMRL